MSVRSQAGGQLSAPEFEALGRALGSMVWEAQPGRTLFTYVSEQAERLLGYPVERWLSEPGFWASHIHPQDRESAVARCLEATEVVDDRAVEYRMIGADGQDVWFRDIATVVPHGQEPALLRGMLCDITAQKRDAAALREGEERFRAFAESTTAALWAYNAEGWTYCNDAISELTGYPRSALMQPRFYLDHVIHPEFRADADARSWRRLRGEATTPWLEYKIVTAAGEERWLRATGSTFTLGGRPAAVATAFDITERKLAEDILRRSEERLDLAIRGADLAIWDYDWSAGTTTHDDHFSEILRRPIANPIPASDWTELVHPDDRARLWKDWKAHVRGSTPSFESEFRIAGGGERWRWLRSRGRVMAREQDGTPARVAGTYLDITDERQAKRARAESEADMRAMFENSGDGIILLSPDFQILRANRQARDAVRKLFERDLDEGRSMLEQVPPNAREFLRATVSAVCADGQLVNVEADLTGPEGSVPHEFDFAPIYLDDGTLRGVGMAVRNISKRRADEAALRQAQRMESLGQLVGGIAHDFNNLLAAILGYGELAAAELPDDSPARADVEEVVGAARRASDLTRQLLTFARRQYVEPRDVDINELLVSVQRLLSRVIGEDIALMLSLDEQPLIVRIDPSQFEQVILNFVVNARDAMPSGGRLTITTRRFMPTDSKRAHGWARVAVTDTGSGMTPETTDRIFEPFFTTKEPGKGTGLGMATAHGIITQADGRIDVETELGRGTTISALLPLSAASPAPLKHPEVAPELPEATCRSGRILVVEDQPEVRRLVERTLKRFGYEVLTASNPVEAIELAAARPEVDLIVSDLVMPFMDGVALSDVLLALLGAKPVIFMSGYADSPLLSAAASRPRTRFLAKPFAAQTLAELVRDCLSEGDLTSAPVLPLG